MNSECVVLKIFAFDWKIYFRPGKGYCFQSFVSLNLPIKFTLIRICNVEKHPRYHLIKSNGVEVM